jgi:GT2 family glycosyltransferase
LKEADQHPYLRQSIIQNTGLKPSVSIIVVNWNGKALLKDCLGALCHQTYPNKQIILVDNGSVDQSVIYVRENFPLVKAVELSRNTGFTGGNLAGLLFARGDFVALVNNDTRAQDHWLENLIQPMLEDSTVGICASKVLFDDGRAINSAGDGLTTAAVGFNRGLGKAGELFMDPEFVFGACGAAVLYRRRMLNEIGFLDDDFFLYDEDTDLNFRAQLAGWKCAYVPNAIVYHKSNATSGRLSDLHVYYHSRNLEFVWLKNMPASLMLRYAHHKLIQEFGSFLYLCVRHGKCSSFFRAKKDALKMFPLTWRKRKEIQAKKRVPNSYLRELLSPMFTRTFLKQKFRQFIEG